MGIVSQLVKINLEKNSAHRPVDCTYSIVIGESGEKYLQVDTYGSADRQIHGKKSQSIRFSKEAVDQLKQIIEKEL